MNGDFSKTDAPRPPRSRTASMTSRSTSTSRSASSEPEPPTSRPRTPLPPTLHPCVSSLSIRRPSASIKTGAAQKLTAVALPAHMKASDLDGGATSSRSSVIGVGTSIVGSEATLVYDEMVDVDTETESGTEGEEDTDDDEVGDGLRASTVTVKGQTDVVDDESRKVLRDQLRRSMSQRRGTYQTLELSHLSENVDEVDESQNDAPPPPVPRQYFVLTDAGKPVFVSETSPMARDPETLASTIGLMQALISVFLDDGDKLRYVNAGKTRISFLLRSTLYYACVSSWGEPESVIRSQLEYLHLQVLSVLSGGQLKRMFERRSNVDVGRLLGGAETFMHSLLRQMQFDLAMSTSSLSVLALEAGLRRKIGETLTPSKMKDLLYVVFVMKCRVVTLVRPRKHSVHPADLHILMNTITAPAVANNPASWIPICLPRFNSSGFLHAYIAHPLVDGSEMPDREEQPQTITITENVHSAESSTHPLPVRNSSMSSPSSAVISESSGTEAEHIQGKLSNAWEDLGLSLVCVSGGGGSDFEAVRAWCDRALTSLRATSLLSSLLKAAPHTSYTVGSLSIPGLRHFVYKNRAAVQITYPVWEGGRYEEETERRRLVTLYQKIHDAIHGRSGQKENLKLQYVKTTNESVMGWITQPFELYVSLDSQLPKSVVVGAANAVARWVKREEGRLFLKDAPVF